MFTQPADIFGNNKYGWGRHGKRCEAANLVRGHILEKMWKFHQNQETRDSNPNNRQFQKASKRFMDR
jgi:hypothetical protein